MIVLAQLIIAVCCFTEHVLSQAFGPTTISQWTVDGLSQFTALSLTVTVPPKVPWTQKGASWAISPFLFNGDVNNWEYYDQIGYSNSTGTPANPETYQLTFYAGQVNSITESTASPSPTVYPGDSVSIAYALQSGTTWKQTWSVAPGAIGTAAGAKASSGTYTFKFPAVSPGDSFNYIWLQAEFNGCFWDFGDLSWQNIKITAATTDTSWCPPYPLAVAPPPYGDGYNATYAGGPSVATVSGSSSTCTLPEMTWLQPSGALAAEAAFQSELAACAIAAAEGEKCHY